MVPRYERDCPATTGRSSGLPIKIEKANENERGDGTGEASLGGHETKGRGERRRSNGRSSVLVATGKRRRPGARGKERTAGRGCHGSSKATSGRWESRWQLREQVVR